MSDNKTSEFALEVVIAADVCSPQLLKLMAPTAPMGELATPVNSDTVAVAMAWPVQLTVGAAMPGV
jgi:hypothetical protein